MTSSTSRRHCEAKPKQPTGLKRFPLGCFARVSRTRNDAKS